MEMPSSIREVVVQECKRLRPHDTITSIEPCQGKGCLHIFWILSFANSPQLIARVARKHQIVELEKCGIHILQHIEKHSSNCPVPRIHWHNLDQTSKLPSIVIQSFVPGRSLGIWNPSIPKSSRCVFMDGLARFLVDVWSIKASTATPTLSYSTWLENDIDRAIRRCITGSNRWGNLSDYLVMRSLIPYHSRGVDHFKEISIAHGDMNAYNFMVNEAFELTGVVDWDWKFEAPLPAVIQFPWFMADIEGWHNEGTEVGESFEDDREYLVRAMSSIELPRFGKNSLATLLLGAGERQKFQSAINYRDIHNEFVESDGRRRI
ncbi:hypothetical protein E4T43_00125 [Aureobasidium subglaciale]|nr:hypothetical protein E4T43_00125 [Aureobasidium subglaciale]